MIKFKAIGAERTLVGMGLTAANLKKLKAGQPILVKLRDMEMVTDIEVCLFYGEDETQIYELLKREGFVTGKTKVKGNLPSDLN